jgi:outer membrane protein TolC
MMKIQKFIIPVVLCAIAFSGFAQENILEQYIDEALESNITLKQKTFSYEKSLEALKEAKRMFLPTLSLEAKYTRAQGGRTVVVPFGEMMNPAYNNLDIINQSMGATNPGYPDIPTYPDIEDYTLNFIREKEQETRLQLQMPVFNSAIIHNHQIKKELADVEKINVDIYKRELVKEVKTAYINYLRTQQVVEVYSNSLEVTKENLRNTNSLFENDKVTIDEVYAAKAKVKEMEKELSNAQNEQTMAGAYLNFLMNRDLNAEIEIQRPDEIIISPYQLESLKNQALQSREELKQLDKNMEINRQKTKMEKGAALPEVSLGATYGYQGEKYSFTADDDFAQAGVFLSWDIFSSGQRKAKISQAKIDMKIAAEKKLEAGKQIQLEVMNTYYNLQTSLEEIGLAKEELENYKKTFQLVNKKYQNGMANHLELANALNNEVNAENKLILARYDYYISQIVLERITSAYQFETK